MSLVLKLFITLMVMYYIGIVYLITNPQVSSEYQAYFISNTSDLSPLEISQLKPIQFNKTYSFKDPIIGFDGWSNAESTFRWSAKKKVKIVFLLEGNQILTSPKSLLVLQLGSLGNQQIELLINGRKLSKSTIYQEMQLHIPIESADLIEGKNVLEFLLPNARSPGNGDLRTLGILLKSFSIRN